jgi:hypothetical protein
MVSITNTTQLSTFSLIRAAIIANSTLSAKFNATNIYQFEPKHKSSSFTGFPYILINIPSTNQQDEDYVGDRITRKDFEVEIILRMDYLARDNYPTYASALLYQLRHSRSTFEASGYNLISIDSEQPTVMATEQKEIIEGRFILTLSGEMTV